MALSNSQYESIMRVYNRTQLQKKHELDARVDEVYEKIPAVREMNDAIAAAAVKSAKELLAGDADAVKRLRGTIADLKEQRQVLMSAYGYPADYLEMQYNCPDCKDTGYKDGIKCHCFRQREIDLLYAQSNIREVLERENFSHFSYDYFDDTKIDPRSGKTARAYMEQVTAFCHRYVDGFKEEKGNILFTGKTGLGKTFLSNCIAKELIERCFSVVYLPAVEMYEIFSRDRFANDATDEDRDRSQYLLECDLLIIDDLGTELVNTFTTSQLFYVVNERLNRKKGTIISTNLPVNEMRDEFTDRVMSRIISQYQIIPLYGEDIRIRKKLLSKMLTRRGIPHKVLNAKFHELEAEIVADAGIHGAVTIATNMAGRGTDIKLDEISRELGGLKIIGTERHESRRIDNQLRGRAGRQGDPGESRFYLSLEDDLMRLFGSERLMNMFNAMGVPENEQIEHKMLSKAIEKAQMKIETNNYGIRENLLKYDEVMNEQREAIYAERRRVLDGENMRSVIMKMITDIVENAVDMSISDEQEPAEWDLSELNSLLLPVIPLEPIQLTEDQQHMKKNELKHMLKEAATKLYETREAEFTSAEQVREMERVILLKVVDAKWMAHIDDMDQLREGIGLQAYGQRDPLVEYKMSGYEMFDSMTAAIREDTVRILFHIRAEQKVEREPAAKVTGTNRDDSTVQAPKKREEKKIYPNDPCPCGSGKKYKQCCGRKLYAKN